MKATKATETTDAAAAIIERHDRHMSNNYARYPVAMARGQGARLWDADGHEYLDLFAGFGGPILGHCHPDLVDAVTQQANTLWHVGNLFHTEPQTRLAEAIATHGFGGQSFFCHSGADANEAALKLARLYGRERPGDHGPRFGVVSTSRSFHGRSFGTMPATGQAKVSELFQPLAPGYAHVPYNDMAAVESAIDANTIAILVEPIQGEGGVHVPEDDYLPALRRLCDQRDLLLIVDEVWTGCGRTGKWFAHQHWDIEPDIMTLAKGVGGGLPVGVMCAKPNVAALFDWRKYGHAVHASTLGGNCLSMAVAARIFEVIERDGLLQRAAQLAEHITDTLSRFGQRTGLIREIRGKGLFLGIELNTEAPSAWFDTGADVVNKCRERGLLINATQGNVLRLAPPLTIEREQLDRGLEVLQQLVVGDA